MTARKSWDHGGKNRHQQGYGWKHVQIRRYLMQTVILCEACQKKDPPETTVGTIADHIVPLAKGGSGERENYQLLCPACHDEKTIRDKGHKPMRKRRFGNDGWPVEE